MEMLIRYLRRLKRKTWFTRYFGFYLERRAARLGRPYKIYSEVVQAGRVQLRPQNLGANFWVHARSDLAKRVMRFVDALEENEDVQRVHGNFEFDEATLAALSSPDAG